MSKYKIIGVYTKSHELLYRNYFLPSVPSGFAVKMKAVNEDTNGDTKTSVYTTVLRRKVDYLIKYMERHRDEVFLCSDVDVMFFKPFAHLVGGLLGDNDLVFQRENRMGGETELLGGLNPGFMILKATQASINLFKEVDYMLLKGIAKKTFTTDQAILCQMDKKKEIKAKFGKLPFSFYASTHGKKLPSEVILYHVVGTAPKEAVSSIQRKILRIEDFLRAYNADKIRNKDI